MANQEQLERLLRGVRQWNDYRNDNEGDFHYTNDLRLNRRRIKDYGIKVNLSGADLRANASYF